MTMNPVSPVLQSGEGVAVIEAMKVQRQNVYSMMALQKNLDALDEFLDDNDLPSHAAFLK